MIAEFISYIKGLVVNLLFPKKSVSDAVQRDISMSTEMSAAIDRWGLMYQNKSPWIKDHVSSLNLPASIASEIARLTTLEMVSEVTADSNIKRADYLNNQYQRVVDNIRVQLEYAVAKGGMIFKPYPVGDDIVVDFVQADRFIPIRFNAAGELRDCVFIEQIKLGEDIYTRLEVHEETGSGYRIQNKAYKSNTASEIGKEIPLTSVMDWEDLEPEALLSNTYDPIFAYFKMPLANIVDTSSDLGVSIYAKAENLIKQADEQYSRLLWEYEGGELAIDADAAAFNTDNELPKGKDRLFRKLDLQQRNGELYSIFNPTLRDSSYYDGLNTILRKIEFNCGLAYGTLSEINDVSKTATEIKNSKQRSYSTITDIQKALQAALIKLVNSMDTLSDLYNLAPAGDYDISFTFDDSIIVDSEREQMIMMQEVAAGLIKPEEYLMKRYGVSEDQAKEMLPSVMEEQTEDLPGEE